MTESDPSDPIQARVERARDPSVPRIYFNGFINSLGTSDIVSILERNGEPVVVLNMSYTVAKSFAARLGELVAQLEELSGREMLTTKELETLFLKQTDEKSND